jgi:hypothetical protein
MITDFEIKQLVDKSATKLSIQRLNEKIRLFQIVDVPLISIHYRVDPVRVSRKKVRLYLDLIDVWYPLYSQADDDTKAHFISDVFKCVCTKADLSNLRSFKQITKKKLVTTQSENVKTISRLRWRGRDNLTRNYIHFQH